MTNTAAAEKLAGHGAEKKDEKVEKRRALGRGLESLLPGPRVVAPAPQVPLAGGGVAPVQGSGDGGEQQVPHFVRNDKVLGSSDDELEATRAGAPAPHVEVISIQAVAETRVAGNLVTQLALDAIDKNPYQTRYVFDEDMLRELRDSIKEHGVVQPVVVRPGTEEGRYILVLGERRLRA